MAVVYKDAYSAWRYFRSECGLEPEGRDSELEGRLTATLDPSATSLDAALEKASTDDLVRALFEVLHPFIGMFRDILRFFEKAGATEGRANWNIEVDGADLDLNHFRRALAQWDSVPADITVPAIDMKGLSDHWQILRDAMSQVDPDGGWLEAGPGARADVRDWLTRYRAQRLSPLPGSLNPRRLPVGYSDVAAIASVALSKFLAVTPDRARLMTERETRLIGSDGLYIESLLQLETDYWLGSIVSLLARIERLPPDVRSRVGDALSGVSARYPLRKLGVQLDVAGLASMLSLPVWRKRHELYAVWIGTEIMSALPEHECTIHHEDGKLEFAFREYRLATVETARPRVEVIAEKRSPLSNPIGKGRVANVQPDYGLWKAGDGAETCGLVIEVKHYKKESRSRFAEVLTDYAEAFPTAQVYLVSHGRVSVYEYNLPRHLDRRCHGIGELTADNRDARETFAKAVRDYVGAAFRRRRPVAGGSWCAMAVAIDISPSMSRLLHLSAFRDLLVAVLDEHPVDEVVLIDSAVRDRVPAKGAWEAAKKSQGSPNSLKRPVSELLKEYDSVVLLTDADGLSDLKGMNLADSRHGDMLVAEIARG